MKRQVTALIIALLVSASLHAQTYELAPYSNQQYTDSNGTPLALGQVCTYVTGTTTPLATYSNASGSANTSPCVTLDAAGRAQIYLSSAAYKFILKDSAGAAIRTIDPVQAAGLNAISNFNHTTNTIAKFGGSNTLAVSQLTDDGSKVTLGTSNSFTANFIIAADASSNSILSRASTDTSGPNLLFYKSRGTHASASNIANADIIYGVSGNSYSGGSFFPQAGFYSYVDGTFTSGQSPPSALAFVTNAANGLTANRFIIDSNGYSKFSYRMQGAQGTDTAAANNLTLPANGNTFVISGATQINLLDTTGWQNGSVIYLYFSGAPTIKNAQIASGVYGSIALNGNVDYIAGAARVISFVLINGAWYEIPRKF